MVERLQGVPTWLAFVVALLITVVVGAAISDLPHLFGVLGFLFMSARWLGLIALAIGGLVTITVVLYAFVMMMLVPARRIWHQSKREWRIAGGEEPEEEPDEENS